MPARVSSRIVAFFYSFASLVVVNYFRASIFAATIASDDEVIITGIRDKKVIFYTINMF